MTQHGEWAGDTAGEWTGDTVWEWTADASNN